MLDPFRHLLERDLVIPPAEGPDKTQPLPDAIARFIRPGQTLHLCTTHNRPGAVVLELIRQFRGKNPGFTLSSLGVVGTAVALVHAGLCQKISTTFAGDSYPTPGPNPVIQRAWLQGSLQIENWTILTFPLRLLAGAMGIPYIPTRSLIGSSMAEENKEWFSTAQDPDTGETIGLLRAFRPDWALVHGAAADPAGNVLLPPPYGDEVYGAWAAREGVIATVDRIVSTEFVRRYSHICRVPAFLVQAVCEVPFGAHPGGVSNRGCPEFEAYADDYDFVQEVRQASRSPEAMDAWIKKYVDDCPTWDAYLSKLGRDRIWALKGKADGDSWRSELLELSPDISDQPDSSPVEMMVVAGGRKLAARIREQNYRTILAGVGASNLSAWLAYYELRSEQFDCELMAELGFFGYVPRPADPFIFNYRNLPTCKMLTGIPTIMGVFMGGANNSCIGSIGAAQVDRHGNVNSTLIPGKFFITGSGGANDICSAAREVMVTALQDKNRFLPKVSYISSPGQRVRTVVSDLGIYEKQGEELVLTTYFPRPELKGEEAHLRFIRENTGWDLKIAPQVQVEPPPSLDELKLLRLFDPRRQFLGKR